jgi:translation initiation factor 2 beta subunit (eIF-2beta)/eIF-5
MRLFFAQIVIFLSIASVTAFSESQHNSTLLERIGSTRKRAPVTDRLSEGESLFLTENFFRIEESIKDRYDNKTEKPDLTIAEGITSALSKAPKETILATALADLAGSLNKTQLENLQKVSEALAAKIREQEPKDRDLRLLALIERSEWLTYIVRGQTPPTSSLPQPADEEAFERFKKEFKLAKKEVNQRNRQILDYIQEAKGGNKDAKQWLRQKLDLKSFATFMKGQKDFGGDALFEDVAEAMVWDDKDLGAKYHDFTDQKGNPIRLVVGKDPKKHAKHLADFLKKEHGRLGSFSLSPTRLKPNESQVVNLTGTRPVPPATSLATKALPVFKQACVDCHRTHQIPISSFSNAATLVQTGEMPQDRALSESEKKALIDFFLSPEPKEPFLQLIR